MRADDDESVAFESSAFDVVSSWLLGGRSAAALAADEDNSNNNDDDDANETTSRARAPVTLYRPTASAKPSLTGRISNAGDAKVLTEEEKEMRKKLLRKSGSYKAALETEAESALKVAQDEELDREEQALIAARNARGVVNNSSSACGSATSSQAPVAAADDSRNPKKRKLNAQDELLEKLRQDAARAKAKNQKAKQRQQRKKEEECKQRALAAARTADSR